MRKAVDLFGSHASRTIDAGANNTAVVCANATFDGFLITTSLTISNNVVAGPETSR